jgi:hypothetical protein
MTRHERIREMIAAGRSDPSCFGRLERARGFAAFTGDLLVAAFEAEEVRARGRFGFPPNSSSLFSNRRSCAKRSIAFAATCVVS